MRRTWARKIVEGVLAFTIALGGLTVLPTSSITWWPIQTFEDPSNGGSGGGG